MGTDGGAVHESHAERKVAPLDEFEQAPPALMRRADETTAPLAVRGFGPVLGPPEDRREVCRRSLGGVLPCGRIPSVSGSPDRPRQPSENLI